MSSSEGFAVQIDLLTPFHRLQIPAVIASMGDVEEATLILHGGRVTKLNDSVRNFLI
jgi:hypothetical protein